MSFFGIINVEEANCDDDCLFITPMDTSSSCICGMGYGLPWYGLAPSFTSIEIGCWFQSPNVPSKSDSYLSNNESSFSQCDGLRWEQLSLTMADRFALSYLASSISITFLVAFPVQTGSWPRQVFCHNASYARFELQIDNIPNWQEDTIYVYGLLFEVQNCAYVMQALLANDKVVQRCISPCIIFYYIRGQVNWLASGVLYKGDVNLTHLFCLKGAVGSTPWLWHSPLHSRYVLIRPFSNENEVTIWSSTKQLPYSFS